MGILLGLIIPTLKILTPLTILILIGRRRNRINRTDFGVAIVECTLVELIVPVVATFLSTRVLAYNFRSDDPKCVTGAAVFIFFRYLIALIGVPIAGIVLFPPTRMTKKFV